MGSGEAYLEYGHGDVTGVTAGGSDHPATTADSLRREVEAIGTLSDPAVGRPTRPGTELDADFGSPENLSKSLGTVARAGPIQRHGTELALSNSTLATGQPCSSSDPRDGWRQRGHGGGLGSPRRRVASSVWRGGLMTWNQELLRSAVRRLNATEHSERLCAALCSTRGPSVGSNGAGTSRRDHPRISGGAAQDGSRSGWGIYARV